MSNRYPQAQQMRHEAHNSEDFNYFTPSLKEKLFGRTIRGKIGRLIAVVALTYAAANALESNNPPTIDGTVAATLTIDSGVNLHSDPHMPDSSGVDGTNVDYTVPQGAKIEVTNPVQVTSMGNTGEETWYGFNVPGVKGTQWMNDSQVESQQLATTTYSSNSATPLDTTYKNGNYYFNTQTGQQQQAGTSEIVSAP